MKIAFFGSPKIAKDVLEKLQEKFPVSLVVTQPDRPVGRKQILTPTPVKLFARQKNIAVTTTTSMIRIIEVLKKENIELAVLTAYGLILPKELLEIPKLGFLNVHFSLLPKYRGAAPVQFAILNGDKKTGVTIMKMNEKLDHGGIVAQEEIEISNNDNAQTLSEKLTKLSINLLLSTVQTIKKSGRITSYPQNHRKATYTRRLTKNDGFIPFTTLQKVLNNEEVKFEDYPTFIKEGVKHNNLAIEQLSNITMHNFIRALYPWPAAWTILPNGKRLKLISFQIKEDKLIIKEVQLEGKQRMYDEEAIIQLLDANYKIL